MINVALFGNPNVGKTTVFNLLTGLNQYVGNWPGVTIEKKEGYLNDNIKIVDLPGIYAMDTFSNEEKDYLSRFVGSDRAHWISNATDKSIVVCSGGAEHINVSPTGEAYRCILDAIDKRRRIGNIFESNFALSTEWTPCQFRHLCPGCDKDKVRVFNLKDEKLKAV